MENKEDKLVELYRNKLGDSKLPVSDRVFTNIKKELNSQNKKKGLGYYSLILLFTLAAGATIGGYFNRFSYLINKDKATSVTVKKDNFANTVSRASNTSEKTLANKESISIKDKTTDNSEKEKITLTTNANTSPLKEKENREEQKNVVNNTFKTNAKNNNNRFPIKEKNKGDNVLLATITTKEINTNVEKNNSNSKFYKKRNKKLSEKVNDADPLKVKSYSKKTIKSAKDKKNIANIAETEKGNVLQKNNENKINDHVLNPLLNANTDSVTNNISKENSFTKLEETKKDSIKDNLLNKIADSIKQNNDNSPSIKHKDDYYAKTALSVDVIGGPSISFRTLKTGDNAGADNRNKNEKMQVTYNAGVDFGITLKNKLYINVGVHLNNKSEKYHFAAVPLKYGTTITPIYDTTAFIGYDTVASHSGGIAEYNVQNKYQFLSIPLMLGYRFSIKDKLFLTPVIGIGFDYLLSAKSSWIDTQTEQTVSYTKANGAFSLFTIAGKINLNIGWDITDKWSLIVQPGYTRSLESIYKRGDELKLYPYSYDLNLAVRFKL